MLETLITVIHILVALFMILVVLVQGGNSGGVSASFGGGSSGGVFGATGAMTILGKMTYGAAILFMMTSLSLSILKSQGGNTGLKQKLATPGATTTTQPLDDKPATAPATQEPKSDDQGNK